MADRLENNRPNKLPALQLAFLFICAFTSLSLLPRVRINPRMEASFLGAAAVLLAVFCLVLFSVRRSGRVLRYEVSINKAHWVQLLMQGSIYVYWAMYWPDVRAFVPFIVAQLLFVYALGMLLAWLHEDNWVLGFGPFPIILSTNLFIWFKDDWFYFQFALIAIGVLGKQYLKWRREGRLVHIFNPSAFSAFVISIALLATHSSQLTWGEEIATTVNRPPHIYLEIFLLGLIVQALFSVTLVTLTAGATLLLLNLAYTHFTGVYHYIDDSIPVAVFIGIHLLITDPATSPKKTVGKIMFGTMYGAGVFGMYSALRWFGQPTFYDKLLCVPLLNLMVPSLDRFSDWVAARVRLLNTDWAFNPQRYNFAHMAVWTALFSGMLFSGFLSKGAEHPGGSLAFWQESCENNRWNACKTYAQALAVTCRFRPGDVCTAAGAMLNEGTHGVKRDPVLAAVSFGRGCQVGLEESCGSMVALLRRDGADALQMACDHGDGTSCLTLAGARSVGMGVPLDTTRALSLYRKACDGGYLMGCRQAARRYLYGQGATADPAMAVQSFEKACRGQDPTSCAEVADLYRQGIGGRKDETLAAERLQQACNLGLESACQAEASGTNP